MTDEFEKEDEYALTAEYVLGLLSDDEAQAYEDVLSVSPELRDEYAFWADRMTALTDDIAPVAPPPHVLKQIKGVLFSETASAPDSDGAGKSWMRRLGLLPAMAGGLVAALVVMWGMTSFMPPPDAPAERPAYVAQIASEDESLLVQASFDASAGNLHLERVAGAAGAGRALELWLIAGDNPPVSLGVLSEGGTDVFPVSPEVALALDGGTLAVSDEPPGGSPTGLPTGAVLALGEVRGT